MSPKQATQTPIPGSSINPMQMWVSAERTIWLTGIAVLLIYSVVSLIRPACNVYSELIANLERGALEQ